jgi:hypothetical protein
MLESAQQRAAEAQTALTDAEAELALAKDEQRPMIRADKERVEQAREKRDAARKLADSTRIEVEDRQQALAGPDFIGVNPAVAGSAAGGQAAQVNPLNVDTHRGTAANGSQPVGLAAGMNNAQAAEFIRVAEARFGKEALEGMAKELYRLNAFRMATDLESGRVTPEQAALYSLELAALLPQMQALATTAADPNSTQAQIEALRDAFVDELAKSSKYVPTTGRQNNGVDAEVETIGSPSAPNVADDKRLAGRTGSIADNAIEATTAGMAKSASAAAWREVGQLIDKAYAQMSPSERATSGITQEPATGVTRAGDGLIIVGDKAYRFADPRVLEALRQQNVETSAGLAAIGKATQIFSYMLTQLNPFFGPRQVVMDLLERQSLIRTKQGEWLDANGQPIDVNAAADAAMRLSMSGRPLKEMFQFHLGKNEETEFGQLLKEFQAQGGTASRFTLRLSPSRKSLVKQVTEASSKAGALRKDAAEWVGAYNNVFQDHAGAVIYGVLRGQGMSKKDAAAAVLQLWNSNTQGSSITPRMLYAFARPAAFGAKTLVNSLRTESGRAQLLGFTLVAMALTEVLRGMAGEDEEGRNKYDTALSGFEKDTVIGLPIPGTDKFIKLPVGQGIMRVALSLSNLLREAATNPDYNLTDLPKDVALRIGLPTLTPLQESGASLSDDPVEAVFQFFSPSVLRSATNVAVNKDSFGRDIAKPWLDRTQFKSEQGYEATPEFYKSMAKGVRETTGLDLLPEQFRELLNGVLGGLPKSALQTFVDVRQRDAINEAAGREPAAGVTPVLRPVLTESNPQRADAAAFSDFEKRGLQLVKQSKANEELELSDRDALILDLYREYEAAEKKRGGQSAGLSRRGIMKSVAAPERQEISQERAEQRLEILRALRQD